MDLLDCGRFVIRIVITGGPCGGKTISIRRLLKELHKEEFARDYVVLTMDETATQLIGSGINPLNCLTPCTYQLMQMKLQYFREKIYAAAAEEIAQTQKKSVIILYDRGMMDNKAYIPYEEFLKDLDILGLTEDECLSWYDAVYHMMTAAKGAEKFYSKENNRARMENPKQAAYRDDRTLKAWEDHPARKVFDNSTGFPRKVDRLVEEIKHFLREEVPEMTNRLPEITLEEDSII